MIFKKYIASRSIGLLKASKHLCNEFAPLLREGFVLSHRIKPSAAELVVEILNQNGAVVSAASSHPDYSSVLGGMLIDRFCRIEIAIEASNSKDPDQLVRA